MTTIPAYPLQWPAGWKREPVRKRAKFSKSTSTYVQGAAGQAGHSYNQKRDLTVSQATDRVRAELRRLAHADDFVISTNLRLRLDGLPRSDQAQPTDPGVAVYWQSGGGKPRVMAIDIYDRVADNLAAVAATLEAMRAIERHGGAAILERTFTGFDALPPPRSCWQVLGLDPRAAGMTPAAVTAAYRKLAMDTGSHPDHGGTDARMTDLNVARDECLRQLDAR